MPSGMQVFDETGRLIVDLTKNFSQEQGKFITNATNGSGTMSPLPSGKSRFYSVVGRGSDGAQPWQSKLPGVTVNGNVITWSYSHSTWFGQYSQNSDIYYGFF